MQWEFNMPSPDVTVRVSMKARNLLIAKTLVITIIGLVCGYFYHVGNVADYQRGQTITPAEYAATFESYRARLLEHTWPLWGDVILFLLMILVMFAIYEGLGYCLAWVVGRVLSSGQTDAPSPMSDADA